MFSWLPEISKLSFLEKFNARLVAHSCQSVSIPIPCCHCYPSAGTVTNTCPARRTSTGRPGLHGNAATCPVAEVSSLGAEPARTATTVPGVVRYVTQTIALARSVSVSVLLSSLTPHCSGAELEISDATSSQRRWNWNHLTPPNPPGCIFRVAAPIAIVTGTYLIPPTHIHTYIHTYGLITSHTNRLIFCCGALPKARMMQESVEIRVFVSLTELLFLHKHAHSYSRTGWK